MPELIACKAKGICHRCQVVLPLPELGTNEKGWLTCLPCLIEQACLIEQEKTALLTQSGEGHDGPADGPSTI